MPFLDELATNTINTLYQDRQGYIWIGTSNGLARYDGYDVQIFRNNYESPELLTNNYIMSFAEDDKFIWVGTGEGVTLIDKVTYQITPFPDKMLEKDQIRDILTDKKGNIWIGSRESIYLYNADLTRRKIHPLPTGTTSVNSIYEDNKGDIWVLTWGRGLFRYEEKTASFVSYPPVGDHSNPFQMYQDHNGRYWIATWGDGILSFDPNATEMEMYKKQTVINPARNMPEQIFFDIIQDNTYNYLWALSHFGLYIFEIDAQHKLQEVNTDHFLTEIDRNKTFSRMMRDKEGNLWLGAYDQGYTIVFEKNEIENFVINDIKDKIGIDANITNLNKDADGIVWMNQARYGLCLFNEKTNKISYGLETDDLYAIGAEFITPSRIDNSMWVVGRGDLYDRIWKMKQENMNISIEDTINLSKEYPFPGNVTQLLENAGGDLWIGTTMHLYFKPFGVKYPSIVLPGITSITDMKEDRNGDIWISTPRSIFHLKHEKQPLITRRYAGELSLSDRDNIEMLCIDKEDNIWFSTSLGRILQLDRGQEKITDMTPVYNPEGNEIFKLLVDGQNNWIVYNKEIVCFNPLHNDKVSYTVTDDNIFISAFRQGAAFIDSDGCLYAAGHPGFIKILPAIRHVPDAEANVSITDIKENNQSLLFSPSHSKRDHSINEITLPSNARNLEIFFSTLKYTSAKNIKYAYKLEGADTEWYSIDNGKHSAFYNQLSKGKYTFRVRSSDPYGNWSEPDTPLVIKKLPAWYETWYAYLFYGILTITLLICSIKAYEKRIKQRNSVKFQEELTQAKLNYFTNISHELLTPLSIISCVADDWEQNEKSSGKQVDILKTNVNRLKRLLQQILDFRKIESNKMPLSIHYGNISAFISEMVVSNFQTLCRKKNILMTTNIKREVEGYVDFDKVDKILFNLLSNAIKYTPENRTIDLTVSVCEHEGYRYLTAKVADEGVGIAGKDLKHIFTKFYTSRNQSEYESNGIGLSLTKELVFLHHGTIDVSSELNRGSVFTIELPIDKEFYNSSELCESTAAGENKTDNADSDEQDDKPCILFIDDNDDLRELMWDMLHRKYHVIVAKDGEEGLELLKNHSVDVIISDVMMPRMDGLEFCRCVKEDLQTNHIPVLMLTAKNAMEDQIDCYKAGAESYISKPFDMKIIQARIENLLKARELRQQSFRAKMSLNISNLDYQSVDEKFLNEAILCVEKHLDESDFDIPQMSAELNMSRATLNRKCRAITGLTPLDFIRNVKLKHACTLLKKKSINVSEVAYATGFSSPKYFTKCFKNEFGITPTEYQKDNCNINSTT